MLRNVLELLVALASYRLTRLLVQDQFPPIAVQRERIAERAGDESAIAYLVRCPWCAGVYVSGAVTLATTLIVGLAAPILVWGAAAAAVGLLSTVDRYLDKD